MGRPKGSKNKPKGIGTVERTEKRRPSRPAGIKNKPKVVPITVAEEQKPKKTGRPKGSKSSYTVSEKALAQRRKNSATVVQETAEGKTYNMLLIEHIMRINEIAMNADRHDLLSLKSCFFSYLRLCQEDGFSVGNIAAYRAMGMSVQSFHAFSKRDDPEIKDFVEFVRGTCAMFRENSVEKGNLNPVIGIFWQRNFDGLRNDTEQIQAAQEQDDDIGRNDSYKDKYKKLIGG